MFFHVLSGPLQRKCDRQRVSKVYDVAQHMMMLLLMMMMTTSRKLFWWSRCWRWWWHIIDDEHGRKWSVTICQWSHSLPAPTCYYLFIFIYIFPFVQLSIEGLIFPNLSLPFHGGSATNGQLYSPHPGPATRPQQPPWRVDRGSRPWSWRWPWCLWAAWHSWISWVSWRGPPVPRWSGRAAGRDLGCRRCPVMALFFRPF